MTAGAIARAIAIGVLTLWELSRPNITMAIIGAVLFLVVLADGRARAEKEKDA